MDVSARLTSKGQVTLPKAVRDALGLEQGDQVVFRVEGRHATLARTPDLLDVAGAVRSKRRAPWPQVRGQTWAARGRSLR